jgi:hypothetical protein
MKKNGHSHGIFFLQNGKKNLNSPMEEEETDHPMICFFYQEWKKNGHFLQD